MFKEMEKLWVNEARQKKIPCRFFKFGKGSCKNGISCPFSHDKQKKMCKFGLNCTRKNCYFDHPKYTSSVKNEEKDIEMCFVCCNNPKEAAFVPCGHQLACIDCSKKCKVCPVCRVPVQSSIKVFKC